MSTITKLLFLVALGLVGILIWNAYINFQTSP